MSQTNQVSFNIPEAEMAEITAHLQALNHLLLPYLKVLSPEERRELPRMGDLTFSFVQKTLDYCRQNPELVPNFLDVDQFVIDFQGYQKVRSLYQQLLQVVKSLSDTMTLSGSEAYSAALIFYSSARNAVRLKVQTAETVFRDLSASFPRGKRGNREDRSESPSN